MTVTRERVGRRVAAVAAVPVPDPVTVRTTGAWHIVARHCPAVERVVYDIHRSGEHPDLGLPTLEAAAAYAAEMYDNDGDVI